MNRNKRQGTDVNLDFVHTFNKPQQELSFLSQYTILDTDTRNYQKRYNVGEAHFYLQRNNNDGGNNEMTFQLDYVPPFEHKTPLEVGAKLIFRDMSSEGFYRDIYPDTEESEREAL